MNFLRYKLIIIVGVLLLMYSPVAWSAPWWLGEQEIMNRSFITDRNAIRVDISGSISVDMITADSISVDNNLTADTIHTYISISNDGSTSISSDLNVYGVINAETYIDMPEIGDPGAPAANDGRWFVSEDLTTLTKPYFQDSAGTIYDLTGTAASAPTDATYITQTANGTLTNEQNLDALASGIMYTTNGTGVVSIAIADTDYQQPITWGDGLEYAAPTASVDFNTTNLQITATEINTIQDIDTTASPTFTDLQLSNSASISGDLTVYGDLNAPIISILSDEVNILSDDLSSLIIDYDIMSAEVGTISREVNIISGEVNVISGEVNTLIGVTYITQTASTLLTGEQNLDALNMGILFVDDDGIVSVSEDLVISSLVVSGDVAFYGNFIAPIITTMSDEINILSADVNVNIVEISIISEEVGIISRDIAAMGGGTTQPHIQFTIIEPDLLPAWNGRGDYSTIVWTNDSGSTFTISKMEAFTDVDGYAFDLIKSSSLTDVSLGNQASVDGVSCDSAGTGLYSSSDTSFTSATIENDKHLIFRHEQQDASNVKVNIYGSF